MMAHFLGDYFYSYKSFLFICLMKSVSVGVCSHITIVFAVESYYSKWCFFGPVWFLCFYEKRCHFMLLI